MKIFKIFLSAILFMGIGVCFAQDGAESVPDSLKSVLAASLPFLGSLLEKAPEWLVKAIFYVGSLRLMLKPLMSLALSIIEVTPSSKDNEFLEKLKGHKAYQIVVYMLDWFGSIKLPKKE